MNSVEKDSTRDLTVWNSNTKVNRFMAYAEGVSPFREVAKEAKAPNAYTTLQDMDQDKTCHIAQAADLVIMLTKGLDESKGVFKLHSTASSATWTEVSYPSLLQT